MACHDAVWQEAERRIQEAIEIKTTYLSLSSLVIETLPPSIKQLATQLEMLDLSGCPSLIDISQLENFSSLRTLNLNACVGLKNLDGIKSLTGLRHLDVGFCENLKSLAGIESLTSLQSLDVGDCDNLESLAGIESLTSLQSLTMVECKRLESLAGIESLTNLQHLNLGRCRGLKSFVEIKFLTSLQTLYMKGCDNLKSLKGIESLTHLRGLDVSYCYSLENLEGLDQCRQLRSLEAYWIKFPLSFNPRLLNKNWPDLEHFVCRAMSRVPRELLSKNHFENCLPRLRQWASDLEASGEAYCDTVKLFVLGNGRVGKTQIARRLCGKDFDKDVPSTHGVMIERFELLPADPACAEAGATFARLWDFGGQDIYLGTHSLFLDERAIYLLMWTPALETDKPEIDRESGIEMPRRRLPYWLDYVKAMAGKAPPVVVAQARCDAELDVVESPVPQAHGFERLRVSSCSAVNKRDGLERLLPELKSAARLLQERFGKVVIPRSWLEICHALKALEPQRVITREQFNDVCQQHRVVDADELLLDYLHQSGKVFCKPHIFGGQVVLDQAWALEGIYAVLHRKEVLPRLRKSRGVFSPWELGQLLWNERYSQEEQRHFLSLMQSCGICFKVGEDRYIATDCLPERQEVQDKEKGVWRRSDAGASVEIEMAYDFFHEGIARSVISALGRKTGADAVYWRYGACFYDIEAEVQVRIYGEQDAHPAYSGAIRLEVSGAQASNYAQNLLWSVERAVSQVRAPKVRWKEGGLEWRDSPDRRLRESKEQAAQEPFADVKPEPLPEAAKSDADKPTVYVSYAWGGDDGNSDKTVERLLKELKPWVNVMVDKKQIPNGSSIRAFEKAMGRSACIIVIMSTGYTTSLHCMLELSFILKNAKNNIKKFAKRIVPVVLEGKSIDTPIDRDQCAAFVEGEIKKLRQLSHPSVNTTELIQELGSLLPYLNDVLYIFADTVTLRGYAKLSKANFQPVVDLVKKRLKL